VTFCSAYLTLRLKEKKRKAGAKINITDLSIS
jgi:hypothetical protein